MRDGIDPHPIASLAAETVWGDVRRPESLARAVEDVESVFHCAGLIQPRRIRDLFDVNTTGTANMLAVASSARVAKFVYVSTDAVRGSTRTRELVDESQPCQPESAYGKSKWAAEQLVNDAHHRHGLATVIVRPAMLYGPGHPERMTRLMRMIKNGRPPVFGDGGNWRSMAYLDNVVDGLLLAEGNPVAIGQTYWIADERPYTTLEILQTIGSILGVHVRPRRFPAVIAYGCQVADVALSRVGLYMMALHAVAESVKNVACGIDKAREELGYRPKVSLAEGMRAAIAWCRARGDL